MHSGEMSVVDRVSACAVGCISQQELHLARVTTEGILFDEKSDAALRHLLDAEFVANMVEKMDEVAPSFPQRRSVDAGRESPEQVWTDLPQAVRRRDKL